jgi:sulfate-transporting ATPase
MTVLLEARGLTAGYGSTAIVRELNLEVAAGEVVALLGPNGAGKTTTLLTLAGELPALGGQVFLHGAPTTAALHQRVRAGLGLVSEERTVLMTMTVAENFRVNRGDTKYALELFPELVPHLKRKVGMLSGGQQQMLALARALSRRPRVLLADELSLGLGPLVVNRLLKVVRDAADEGVGVLLVEQHIHKALSIADRGYVLQRGHVALTGPTSMLREHIDEVQASANISTRSKPHTSPPPPSLTPQSYDPGPDRSALVVEPSASIGTDRVTRGIEPRRGPREVGKSGHALP